MGRRSAFQIEASIMNPAYSVILFTAASGAGYGLLALLGLVGLNHGQASNVWFALVSMFIALALITTGLLSSTFHLGRPERAWRAFSQWRSSWLSREGIAAVMTYPAALIFGAVWSGLVDMPSLIAPFGLLAIFMCLVTVICTGMIYASLKTIRAWNHRLTVPVYLAFSLATGAVLLLFLATFFGRYQIFQLAFAGVSLILVAGLKFAYWRSIDNAKRTHTMASATGLGDGVRQWEVPHTATNFIMKEMGFVVARRHAMRLRALFFLMLAFAAGALTLCLLTQYFSILALITLGIAAWIERWLFFAEAEHVVQTFYGQHAV
ncbi:MAG: dimethyl sulfoxide reductase anchor subunit family protein [Rhizobiaceae bacterium]